MLIFVSSTYRDLKEERAAVQTALQAGQAAAWGMEFFHSQPERPLDACLKEVRQCGAIVLIIGFRGGSLIPGSDGLTYTAAEIEEAQKLGLPVFAFVKAEGGSWHNDEPDGPLRVALDQFKSYVVDICTASLFDSLDKLRFQVLASVQKWTELGRPGARKTFASRDEFFTPYEQPTDRPRLFDFRQKLEGRASELGALNAFLSDSGQVVALVTGRGGIGKTKLLHHWTDTLGGFHICFLRAAAVWHSESDKEIPSGDVLIIADDAHRSPHLQEVLVLTQTLVQSVRPRVKLVLSTRPSGLLALRSALSRFFEPPQILEVAPIEKLRKEEVRALASELLGPDYAHLRDWLVDLSMDTPLVTVVGGRLVARGKLTSAAITNEAEFRQAVFDRFIDEYTTALPNDGFPWRKLIHLMAAVSPTRARTESFLSASEAFLSIPRHEITQAVDQLEAHGLLIRDDDRLRIAPDTLGDFLLEGACINSHGEATGYADAVFRSFHGDDLPSLLSNLAELEWRLEQKNSPGRVLRGIWNTIDGEFRESDALGRCDMLDALKGAAVFQPNQAMRIVRCAMETEARSGLVLEYWERTHRDVLETIPPLLGSLAYYEEHTEEAVRRLFALSTKVPAANPSGRSPGKVLLGLASYQMYKPAAFLSRVADISAALAREPDAFAGPVTPLDVVDQLLQREVHHEDFTEFVFRIGSLELKYSVFAPVRQKALAVTEESLYAANPQRSGRAVESFSSVLSSFAPIVGRQLTDEERRWQDEERLQALGMIERRVRQSDTPMPLLRQLRNALRQHRPRHHSERFNHRLREVADAIPDSEELSSFDAFCTPEHEWRFDVEDFLAQHKLARSALEAAVGRFLAVNPSTDDKLVTLEKMARNAEEYGIDTGQSACSFLELLCCDGEFTSAFVEYVLNDPHPRLGFQIRMLLPCFRDSDPLYYERIGLACAAHMTGDVAWGAAHGVCFGPQLNSPITQDGAIIAELARHPNPDVRRLAIEGASRLGRNAVFQQQAATIIAGVDLARSIHLANSVCEAFGVPGMPIMALSSNQIQSILGQLVPIDRLDDQQHDVFFTRVGEYASDPLFDFFFERLKRYGEVRCGKWMGYAHWGNTPVRTYFANAQPPAAFAERLRKVRDLLLVDALPNSWIAELFWVFGNAGGEAAQVVLNEWLNSGDPEKILLAKGLAGAGAAGNHNSVEVGAGLDDTQMTDL